MTWAISRQSTSQRSEMELSTKRVRSLLTRSFPISPLSALPGSTKTQYSVLQWSLVHLSTLSYQETVTTRLLYGKWSRTMALWRSKRNWRKWKEEARNLYLRNTRVWCISIYLGILRLLNSWSLTTTASCSQLVEWTTRLGYGIPLLTILSSSVHWRMALTKTLTSWNGIQKVMSWSWEAKTS